MHIRMMGIPILTKITLAGQIIITIGEKPRKNRKIKKASKLRKRCLNIIMNI